LNGSAEWRKNAASSFVQRIASLVCVFGSFRWEPPFKAYPVNGVCWVESSRAAALGTETAVRYTAWWCAVIGGNIGS